MATRKRAARKSARKQATATAPTTTGSQPNADAQTYQGGKTVFDFARALSDYAAQEGLGTNDPITHGDFIHVANAIEQGRNVDGTDKD